MGGKIDLKGDSPRGEDRNHARSSYSGPCELHCIRNLHRIGSEGDEAGTGNIAGYAVPGIDDQSIGHGPGTVPGLYISFSDGKRFYHK